MIDRWDEQLAPFVPRLRAALEDALRGLIGETPLDDIAGLAVYADHDGTWLDASAQTFDDLDTAQARQPELAREYRWSPAEWPRQDLDRPAPRPLTDVMTDITKAVDTGEHDPLEWVLLLMNWVVDQLGAMLRDGWFDEFDEALVLVVDVPEQNLNRETRLEWIAALNEPENVEDYRRWLDGELAAEA